MPRYPKPDSYWLSLIDKTDTCWMWTGGRIGRYGSAGSIRLDNGKYRNRPAHHWSYVYHYGPIPDGLHVLHRCDVPLCVRPDHLFLGTHADNMRDRAEKGRYGPAYNRKLTPEQVAEIRNHGKWGQGDLIGMARKMGVSKMVVIDVRRGKTYKD